MRLADWNGEVLPLDQVAVPIFDSGFQFGWGVYEDLRVFDDRIWSREEHMSRLERSLQEVGIKCDLVDLSRRLEQLIREPGPKERLAHIIITKGNVYERYKDLMDKRPNNELLFTEEFDDPFVDLRQIGAKAITHPDLRWKRPDIKTINLLANTIASRAADNQGCQEAVFLDQAGRMRDGSTTNIFVVMKGVLHTHPADGTILSGVTRDFVINLARRLSIPVSESPVFERDFALFDEMFMTGTTAEILPIVELNGHRIGHGSPGQLTTKLAETFRVEVEEWRSIRD